MFAFLFPLFLSAQQPGDTLNSDNRISEVVVTGQYGENSLKKSVYKVKVISSERIRRQGAVNLKDIMANELNVRINNDPALGSGITIQGLSGQNVKIMIDGVPVIGREGGMIDLSQLNLANIERIEFVEGPMSVNFGTDALGGVINLITKKPAARQLDAGVNAYYESTGQYNAGFTTSLSNTKWDMQLNGARNFFDGYSETGSGRFMLFKPRTQYFGDVNFGRRFKRSSLRLQNSFFDEKVTNRDSGTITPFYAFGLDQYYYTRRLTSSLFYKNQLSDRYAIDAVVSYNFYRRISNTVRKDLVTLEEILVPQSDLQDTTYFHSWMSRGTFSGNQAKSRYAYQVGYEVNSESNEGGKIRDGKQSISDYNIFASMENRFGRFVIRPALRAIYNTKFEAPLIPSLNVKWDLTSYLTVRASYGRGFRAPNLKELYLDFVDPSHNVQGNPDLKAETQHNYQLATGFEWKKTAHIFRAEPSVFYNYINNRISLALQNSGSGIAARYINVSTFQSAGANFTAEYRTPVYSFIAGYAYTGVNNNLLDSSVTDKFFFSHEVRFNFNYTFTKQNLTVSLFYKYNGRYQVYQYDLIGGAPVLGFIDPYHLLDMSVSKTMLKEKLSLTVGSRNMLNVKNVAANISGGIHSAQSNAASIGMGTTFFCSIAYRLSYNKK